DEGICSRENRRKDSAADKSRHHRVREPLYRPHQDRSFPCYSKRTGLHPEINWDQADRKCSEPCANRGFSESRRPRGGKTALPHILLNESEKKGQHQPAAEFFRRRIERDAL